jgi:hypothetical protein
MLDFQINDFWDWFEKNSNKLHSDSYDRGVLQKLDQIILDFGLTWEIGPGLTKENSLTISPNGQRNLIAKAKEIIDKAPSLGNWEYHFYKQPKENWDKASLDNDINISASDWTYVLLKFPDNKFEITIKADNLKSLDMQTKELVVDLVLTNLLGEKRKIDEINFIEIVDDFEGEKGITQIKFLPAHLDKIKNGA